MTRQRGRTRWTSRALAFRPAGGPGAVPGCVLVIDHAPAVRAVLRAVLERAGYAVLTAADGAAGLAALRRARPRAVLLEMGTPRMDGWGFVQEVRRRGYAVPIVVLAPAGDADWWAAAIGAAGALAKPIDLDALIATVERCCGPP